MKRALFILLDNTLILDINGKINVNLLTNWKFNLNVLKEIKFHYNKNYHIHIISNQPLINRGLLDEKIFLKKIELICKEIEKLLELPNNTIYYSFAINEESYSYLPKGGMIFEIALEHELDIKKSKLIGTYDYDKDIVYNTGIGFFIDSRKQSEYL